MALLIMAFAVLLAVSLSAVVELQMRNSRSALSENKARNAAKFAAYMAMAQVQSSLGPDCRISANAAIFDEEIFPEIQRLEEDADYDWWSSPMGITRDDAEDIGGAALSQNRHWVGVWDSRNECAPDKIMRGESRKSYADRTVKKAIVWLVSGNDTAHRNDADGAKHMPTEMLEDGNYMRLVSCGSVADKHGMPLPETDVLVPAVKIGPDSHSSKDGKYARLNSREVRIGWWVSDEGQKAPLNAVAAADMIEHAKSIPHRLQTLPFYSGAKGLSIPDFGDAFEEDEENAYDDFADDKFRLLDSLEDIDAIKNSALPDFLSIGKFFFHAVTVNTKGVLANVREGGLKKDLSLGLLRADFSNEPDLLPDTDVADAPEYFRLPEGVGGYQYKNTAYPLLSESLSVKPYNRRIPVSDRQNLKGKGRIFGPQMYGHEDIDYETASAVTIAENAFKDNHIWKDPGGPLWDQLRSYYNLRADDNPESGTLNARMQTDDRMGFKPVVKRFQVFYVPAFVHYGDKRYGLRLHIIPLLVLWNPYDTKIAGDTFYAIRLSGTEHHQPGAFRFAVGYRDAADNFQCLRDLRAETMESLSANAVSFPEANKGLFFAFSEKAVWNAAPDIKFAKNSITGNAEVQCFMPQKSWFYNAAQNGDLKLFPLGYGGVAPSRMEFAEKSSSSHWEGVVRGENLFPDFATAKQNSKKSANWSARVAMIPLYLNNVTAAVNHGRYNADWNDGTGLFAAQRNICAYRPANASVKFEEGAGGPSSANSRKPHSHSLTSNLHFLARDPSGIEAGKTKIFAMQRIVNYLGGPLNLSDQSADNGPNGDLEGGPSKSMYERKNALMLPLGEGGKLGGCFYLDVPHAEAEHFYKHNAGRPHDYNQNPKYRYVLFDLKQVHESGIADPYGKPPENIDSYLIDMQDIVGLAPVDESRPLKSVPNQTPIHYAQQIYSPDYFASSTISNLFGQKRNPQNYANIYLTVWIWKREGFEFKKFSVNTSDGETADTGLAPVPESGPVLLHVNGRRLFGGQHAQSFPDPSVYYAADGAERSALKNFHVEGSFGAPSSKISLRAYSEFGKSDAAILSQSWKNEFGEAGDDSETDPLFRSRYFINWLGINPRRHSANCWPMYGGQIADGQIGDIAPKSIKGAFINIEAGDESYETELHAALQNGLSETIPYGFVFAQPYAENNVGSQPFFNRKIFTQGSLSASVFGYDYNGRNVRLNGADASAANEIGMIQKTVQAFSLAGGGNDDGMSHMGYAVSTPDGIRARAGLKADIGTACAPIFHILRKTEVVSNPANLAAAQLGFGSGTAFLDPQKNGYFEKSYGLRSPESLQASFAIGNSLCPYRISPERSYQIMWADGVERDGDYNGALPHGIADGARDSSWNEDRSVLYDMSWHLNNVLWDEFFFSTLPYRRDERISSFYAEAIHPQNPRIQYYADAENRLALKDIESPSDADFAQNAAKLWINGPFNVNSTSVDAWKAVLSTYMGCEMEAYKNNGNAAHKDRAPMHRWNAPYLSAAFTDASDLKDEDMVMQGYRALGKNEIEELAAAIVEHVKDRGPFYSMSHFVNRVVGNLSAEERREYKGDAGKTLLNQNAGDDRKNLEREYDGITTHKAGHMQNGVLQAAIDSTSINAAFHKDDGLIISLANDRHTESVVKKSALYDILKDPRNVWENWRGAIGPQAQGAPAYLMQQDILARLGSFLTVRSDTFKIRACGEVRNPVSGVVEAKAWCEMTIQRVPDYFDSSNGQHAWLAETSISETNGRDDGESYGSDGLNDVNRALGRRFKIVSFRWLNEKEI